MSQNFIEKMNFFTRRKNDVYDLMIINENSLFNKNERMNTKIILLSILIIQQYHEKSIFDIVRMITYDVVLKMF